MLQVQGDAGFVTVNTVEVAAVVMSLVIVEIRALMARLIAAKGFDLDYLGAHVAKHHRAVRPGQHLAQVEHGNTSERPAAVSLPIGHLVPQWL